MLSAVLLFIPLLAGYIFTVTWRYSRYRSAREDSQRLYFRAASYGVFLAALAFLTLFLVKLYCPKITTIATSIVELTLPMAMFVGQGDDKQLTPAQWTDAGLFIAFTMLWGSCLGFVLNRGYRWLNEAYDEALRQWGKRGDSGLTAAQRTLKNVIQERGDDLEMMLFTAIDRTTPIQVTLENRKVYIGSVVELIEPHVDRRYLRILPFLSGYRDAEECRLYFTTSYSAIYEQILDDECEDLGHLVPEDFEIVFPISTIQSISLFDFAAYLRFSQQEADDDDPQTTADPTTAEKSLPPVSP